MQNSIQRYIILPGLVLLLFWSVLEYGGRYLYGQTLAQVLCGGLLVLLTLSQIRTHEKLSTYPLLKVTGIWLIVLCISWTFSVNHLASLEELLRYLMYLLLPVLIFFSVNTSKNLYSLAIMMVVTAVIVSGIGWVQAGQTAALTSTFNRTNDLAGYLLLIIPLSLHLTFILEKLKWRILFGIFSALLLTSLIVTQSRSSWLACFGSLILLGFFHREKLNKPFVRGLALSALVFILGGMALKWHTLAPRFLTLLNLSILQENATAWRIELLKGAWLIFRDFPITGSGPNTFASIYPAYQAQPGYFSINPHNYYLQLLAETGILGLSGCLIYISIMLSKIKKNQNPLMAGCLASLSASLFHTGFDIDWSVSAIPIIFFMLVGMGITSQHILPEQEENRNSTSELLLKTLIFFSGLILVILPNMNQASAQAYAKAAQENEQGAYTQAQTSLTKAIQLAPWPSGRHHALAAEIYLQQKEYASGLAMALKSLELDRFNSEYLKTVADILNATHKLKEAESILEKRVHLSPYRHPSYYTDLGDLFWKEKKLEQAKQWYLKGMQAFPIASLGRYERYTPSHRYQLFTLYQHMAQLSQILKTQAESKLFAKTAQEIIESASTDLFIESGLPTPVSAIQNYWKHLNTPQEIQSLSPQAQIIHPPTELIFDFNKLTFLEAKRSIYSATLIYNLPVRKKNQKTWQNLILQDDLQGFSEGWKIVARRAVTPQINKP